MNKLNIDVRKGLYTIEVNDQGDTIVFDTEDIELPFKLNDAYIQVDKALKNLKRQEAVIAKKDDSKKHGLLSAKNEETRKLYKKAYAEMRAAMDAFLGEGGMQKIFGNRNYPDMFDDLFTALKPHFEAMGISAKAAADRVAEKYADGDEDVME